MAIAVPVDQLVVGDVLILKNISTVPCDMLLLNAQCIVDESSLTGESLPCVRTPLSAALSDESRNTAVTMDKWRQQFLIGGSKLLQTKTMTMTTSLLEKERSIGILDLDDGVQIPLNTVPLAIVTATGFSTLKGNLFRTILYPKPLQFSFYKDSIRFLMILLVLAVGAFVKRAIDG